MDMKSVFWPDVKFVNSTIFLGIQIESKLSRDGRTDNVCKKVNTNVYALKVPSTVRDRDHLIKIYYVFESFYFYV